MVLFFFFRDICSLSPFPVWRPVFISQTVETSDTTVSAKNVMQCIQICLRSDGCQLSCFDGENCELSEILVYPKHTVSSSDRSKSCYTRLRINFAVGAEIKGPPTTEFHETKHIENIVDDMNIFSMAQDCYKSIDTDYPLYVMIDLKTVVPVRNITLFSQFNMIASYLFQDVLVFVGNDVDEDAMGEGNFDLMELVGITKPVKILSERQSFAFDQIKFVRYVVLQKTVNMQIQICGLEIN